MKCALVFLTSVLVLAEAQVHIQLPYANPAGVTYSGAAYNTPYAAAQPFVPAAPAPAPLSYAAGPAPAPLSYAAGPAPAPLSYAAGPAPAPLSYAAGPAPAPLSYAAGPAPAPLNYAASAPAQYHRQVIAQLPPLQPLRPFQPLAAPAPAVAVHQKLGFAQQQVLTSVPGVADVPVTKLALTPGFTQQEVDVAHPAVTTRKVKVRRPAVRKEFYDIEHRVIVRPAGSATLELSQPTSKVQQGPAVITPTKFQHVAPVVRYGLTRQIVDQGDASPALAALRSAGPAPAIPAAGPAQFRSAGPPPPPAAPAPAPQQQQQPQFPPQQQQQPQFPQQQQQQQQPQFPQQQQQQQQQPQYPQPQPPQQFPQQQPQQQGPQAQPQQPSQPQFPQGPQFRAAFQQFQQQQAQPRQAVDQDTEVIEAARDDFGPQQQEQQPQFPQPAPQQPPQFPQQQPPQQFPPQQPSPSQQPAPPQQPAPQPLPAPGEGVQLAPGMPAELQARLLQLLTAKGGTVTELLNEDGRPADSASVLQVADALGGDINLQGSERITTRRIVVSRPIETVQEVDIQEPATKIQRVVQQQPALFKTPVQAVARFPVNLPAVKNIATPVVKTTYAAAEPAFAPQYFAAGPSPAPYPAYA